MGGAPDENVTCAFVKAENKIVAGKGEFRWMSGTFSVSIPELKMNKTFPVQLDSSSNLKNCQQFLTIVPEAQETTADAEIVAAFNGSTIFLSYFTFDGRSSSEVSRALTFTTTDDKLYLDPLIFHPFDDDFAIVLSDVKMYNAENTANILTGAVLIPLIVKFFS
eukprot:CAMPEP_0203753568 /NCGR_PEP_ID=MMETSP0098-20131031/7322_1 /ASSEMBLY_ACC=CAM_ASM_000208 /TAXON_ID=96639 /ORGANISM=" , Strain NY0313808BC1" /LENGTH=163 /DNA_ID=CAMNT_0050644225 /DNA_START=224 /DNA_END=715 /DNA_ORIENTATION=-